MLFDGDNDRGKHQKWNQIVKDAATHLTMGIHQFDEDLEGFLGIAKPADRPDLKPINVIKSHVSGGIDATKKHDLENIVRGIMGV